MADLTIVAGDIPTATQWNTYMLHTGGVFNTWVPTVAQSTVPTMTVNRAVYWRAGRMIYANVVITVASGTGVANNGIAVSLPITAATHPNNTPIGDGWILDLSATAIYQCTATWVSTTSCGFYTTSTTASVNAGQTGSAMSAALATGDVIAFNIQYEAAAG